MLKKEHRLKNNAAFTATYRNNDTVGNHYTVIYRGKTKTDLSTITKAGFVVSKKYHKRAVKRNHAKRLFREAYRLLLKEKKIEKSQQYISLVFVIKQDCLELTFDKCYEMLFKLLNL